ncbi:MAG: HutD/Ves family protein [Hyphomicrobiales bacterium]
MRILRAADYRIMPWKNGGGTTTEICIMPEDAGLSGRPFDWRVSIADVASDGPFSAFPGYDRHIMMIEGQGMVLEGGPEGQIVLAENLVPRRFSGDWNIAGRLLAGPVRDFNLMARRDRYDSRLEVHEAASELRLDAATATLLVHVLDGEVAASGHVLACGETLILSPGETSRLTPLAETARLALCRITPRSSPPPRAP